MAKYAQRKRMGCAYNAPNITKACPTAERYLSQIQIISHADDKLEPTL